jgi:hypothetical protein
VSGRDLHWFFATVYNSSAIFDYGVAQVATARRETTLVHTIVVRRYGDGMFPVTVRATFDDGTARSIVWDGSERWRAFDIERNAALVAVAVDPERVLMLDVNFTNNTWTARPKAPEAASRWAMRWLTWMQELLLTYAFVA